MASGLLFVRPKRERQVRKVATFLGHCTLVFVLVACGASGGSTNGGGAGTPPSGASTTVTSISLTPSAATIQAGQTHQLTATAMDANGNVVPNVTITWTSNNPPVASVSSNGIATGLLPGSTIIGAAVGSVSNVMPLTVTPSPVTSIAITPPAASIQAGQTRQFTATATDANGNVVPKVTFTWTSSTQGVATIATSGLALGVSPGATTIWATIGSVNSNPATFTVTPSPVTSISVTPPAPSIQVNQTQLFTATARDANGNVVPNVTFTWTSSNQAVANVSMNGGLATGVSAGSTTITATIGSVSSPASTLTVTPPTVSSITLTPPAASIPAGQTQQFTATAKDINGNTISGVSFTWTSSNQAVASIDGTGFATAGLSGGTTMITASVGGVTSPGVQLTVTTGGGGGGRVYSTNFPLTENPLSEGGNWIDGLAVGLNGSNVQTTPGLAFASHANAGYDDSIAIVTGTWGNDQQAQATAFTQNTENGADREVELLLRFNISANSTTGYEFSFNIGDGLDQLMIVQGLGPIGSFNIIFQQTGSQYHVNNGDVVKATAVGNVLTAYINGVQVAQVTDNLYSSGSPGIGFFLGSGVFTTKINDFGWSSFSATDGNGP